MTRTTTLRALVLIILIPGANLFSQDSLLWSVEGCLTYSHFEQQVKSGIGAASGEKLTDITEFGAWVQSSRNVWSIISVGVYAEYDVGNRAMATFNGFDSAGRATVVNSLGGSYSELWIGPFVRCAFKSAFVDVGYGAVGIRNDKSRDDVKPSSGDASGSFSVNPAVAWYAGVGVSADIAMNVSLVVKLQYRVRYYSKKDGQPLTNNIEHGTQNISPFIGIRYSF